MTTYAVYSADRRIGTVMSFAGEPRRTRWQGYALKDRRQGFPTLKAAMAWVAKIDAQDQPGSPD